MKFYDEGEGIKELEKEGAETLKEIDFLNILKALFAEKETEYPSNWKDIPASTKKDFKSWVKEYQQQDWSYKGGWERAWEIYQRKYIVFFINNRVEELKEVKI